MDKGKFVSLYDWKGAFGASVAPFDYIKSMLSHAADGAAFWNGGSMLSDSEKALAEMMAAQFMDKGDAAAALACFAAFVVLAGALVHKRRKAKRAKGE